MFKQYSGLRKELYILFFGRIVTNLGSMIWPMLTLILTQKLGKTAEEAANWLLMLSIASLPISLFGGQLTDRVNKKNLIVVCDLVSVACFIVVGLLPLSNTSILIFGAASLFQNIEWPAYDALVADFTTPKDRERAYSLSYLGANLGLILSPTIGGFLFKNHLSLAFIINGVSIFTSTILIFFFVKNLSVEYDENDVNEYEDEYKESSFKFLINKKTLLIYGVCGLLYNAIYNQWSYLLPIQLGVEYGENGSLMYGTLTSVNCITVVVATAFITSFLAKVKETQKFILAEVLEVLGLAICVLFIKTMFIVYIGIILFTFGEIIDTIAHGAYISKRIPSNHRGRLSSLLNVIGTIFTSVFAKYIGSIFDSSGSFAAWSTVYFFGVISVLICLVLKVIDKKEYPKLYE